MDKYLVINAGSSSLKFSLYEMPTENEIVNGLIEKIGSEDSSYTLKFGGKKLEKNQFISGHTEAVHLMLTKLIENHFMDSIHELKGIGHRVLHGGEIYNESVIIDETVLNEIKNLTKLGPLHLPSAIAGIETIKNILEDVPQVAVFDTAFHQTMPKHNFIYPVPYEWYTKYGVRKYGFHGTSHKYITEEMKQKYGKDNVNLIICHLGSGASITCVKDGICYDTSMGLTPLDGLMMGTRSGAIDPSILEYVIQESGKNINEVTTDLNKNSGLLGVSGKNDFRDVESLANNGHENSILALHLFKNSIINYIAKYYFELNGKIDALVFTAGIGESAINLRATIVNEISNSVNISLNVEENNLISRGNKKISGVITTPDSTFDVIVEPTNEEIMILRDTYKLINKYLDNSVQKVKKL